MFLFAASMAHAAALVTTEGFDSVPGLWNKGWSQANLSEPPGSTRWFQGNDPVFPAQSGPANSYAAANFLSAGIGGNIALWLFAPVFQFENGNQISFWTRTEANPAATPDRLRLWWSDNDTSTDPADFSTLLSVNESLSSTGYPEDWTRFSYTFSGLSGIERGRFAFEYSVPDTNVNGNYIGIDSLVVTSNIPEPATFGMFGAGLALLLAARRRKGALLALAGMVAFGSSTSMMAEEAKRTKPKWQSVDVEVVQLDVSKDRAPNPSAGRIFIEEGAERQPSNARVAPRAPRSKSGDAKVIQLRNGGHAAELGPSYLISLEAKTKSDRSVKVEHKASGKAEARRDR